MTPDRTLWVFAYGSLMWRPGFHYCEVHRARVKGYRRCFCIHSTYHRGTPERPGLVLGLDRGGTCEGMAFRVEADRVAVTLRYLRQREQVSGVYREHWLTTRLATDPKREVIALAFVVERSHPSYAGRLSLAEQAHLIRGAQGSSGGNFDYLINTLRHLRELGIHEAELERLLSLLGPHASRALGSALSSPSAEAILRAQRHKPVGVRRLRIEQRRRFMYRARIANAAER
jgi:glutathione-specific gamma-glutamylcyclotransferase